MQKFIHDENLKHYRKVLAETSDEGKRHALIGLIRAETMKGQPHVIGDKPDSNR